MSGSVAKRDRPPGQLGAHAARAVAYWPRLDPHALRRTGDDPRKIARLVARRTAMSVDEILAVLTASDRR